MASHPCACSAPARARLGIVFVLNRVFWAWSPGRSFSETTSGFLAVRNPKLSRIKLPPRSARCALRLPVVAALAGAGIRRASRIAVQAALYLADANAWSLPNGAAINRRRFACCYLATAYRSQSCVFCFSHLIKGVCRRHYVVARCCGRIRGSSQGANSTPKRLAKA